MQRAFLDILLDIVIGVVLFAVVVIAPWPKVQVATDPETGAKIMETVWWAQIIQTLFEVFALIVVTGTIITHIVLNTVIYSRLTYGKKK